MEVAGKVMFTPVIILLFLGAMLVGGSLAIGADTDDRNGRRNASAPLPVDPYPLPGPQLR